jgi:hypothetical protein
MQEDAHWLRLQAKVYMEVAQATNDRRAAEYLRTRAAQFSDRATELERSVEAITSEPRVLAVKS